MVYRLLIALALLVAPFAASAQDDAASNARLEARAADIVAVMRAQMPREEVFTDSFNAAVSDAQVVAIREQLEGSFGAIMGVETIEPLSATSAQVRIRLERGIASGQFELEPAAPFEVSGFVLRDVQPLASDPESLLADIAALPGQTNALVTGLAPGATPVLAHNADQPLALGSTFKLYVLSALAHAIAAGDHSWDEVVPLDVRSYPSGQLQNWPPGAPVTLHTLATLMISISDNTATDQLIAVLGRDAVEAELAAAGNADPSLSLPFLTTRELFLLKSGGPDAIDQWRAADDASRRAMLDELANLSRADEAVFAAFAGGPVALDIEWYASPDDLAALMRRMVALDDSVVFDVLGVSPSMAPEARARWAYVGYKGGSEPGVLNLTWLLRDDGGEWSMVTLGWNDPGAVVDLQQLEFLAMQALALAAED